MAEQGGDSEPVGDASDEAGFGGGLEQVRRGGRGEGVGAEGECGHQDEQRGGECFVAVEGAPRFGVRIWV